MLKYQIMQALKIIKNPEKEYKNLPSKPFEETLYDYLRLLLAIAAFVALITFFTHIIRVLYLDIFLNTNINYLRFLNYAIGQSFGVGMVYILSGTLIMFFIALILNAFIRKLKLVELLKVISYSLSPVLLFGYTPRLALALLIWSLVLFFIGVKFHPTGRTRKKSIQQRY